MPGRKQKVAAMPIAALALFVLLALPIAAQDFPPAPAPAHIDTLTLDRAIAEVVARNDRLAAARFMEESARWRVSTEGVWEDPMLMFGVQNAPSNFDLGMEPMTMTMIGVSQNIPYSG